MNPSSLNGTGPQDDGVMSLSSTGMLTGVPWGVVAVSFWANGLQAAITTTETVAVALPPRPSETS